MRALDGFGDVQKTTVFGTAVHAVLKRGRGDVPSLASGLKAQGLEVSSIEQVLPSLEDVFLDVVESGA